MGHIHDNLEYWENDLNADDFVMNVLRNGFRLSVDRSKLPAVYCEKNNALATRILRGGGQGESSARKTITVM